MLPNSFEQENQLAVNRTLWHLAQRFNAVVGCSDKLLFFVCSMYLPICVNSQDIIETKWPIKPCRSVCETVKRDCQSEITGVESALFGLQEFDCHKLEDYDKGVCLTPEAFIEKTTKRDFRKQDFLKKKFDFAIKGKIVSMNETSGGYALHFNVSRVVIKNGILFRGKLARIWSQSNNTCYRDNACTQLETGNEYVILGHKNGKNELTLDWAWAWPRDKHLLDKLRSWKAELRIRNSQD